MNYFLGLDLGQAADYTALTIAEKVAVPVGEARIEETRHEAVPTAAKLTASLYGESALHPMLRSRPAYTERRRVQETENHIHVRHLERFPLGTPYTAVVERVKALMDTEPLKGAAHCVVDATGVGRPVVDMLDAAGVEPLACVYITGGDSVNRSGREYRVPKRDLASALQALLQSKRLKFAAGLPLRDVLDHELRAFKVKINVATGHDSYEAWRERDHDDVVLALALACWYAGYGAPTIEIIL